MIKHWRPRDDLHPEEIEKGLPEDAEIKTLYIRTDRVEQAILVVAVLFVFLGNLRAGLIVVSAIPRRQRNDSSRNGRQPHEPGRDRLRPDRRSVENCVKHLSEESDSSRSVLHIVRDASLEARRPTMFDELIVMIVYLPIQTLLAGDGSRADGYSACFGIAHQTPSLE